MSAEDRAALPLPPELFEALIRVIRETVRAEMRAEFEGRKPGVVDTRSAAQRSRDYEVPETVAGVPV